MVEWDSAQGYAIWFNKSVSESLERFFELDKDEFNYIESELKKRYSFITCLHCDSIGMNDNSRLIERSMHMDEEYARVDKEINKFLNDRFLKYRLMIPKCPYIDLPLPDGTTLRATAVDDENFPAMQVRIIKNRVQNDVCFVEFNPERGEGKELCIGIHQNESEDPVEYKPYYK